MIAGGGRETYDVFNIVGGHAKAMVENNLILPIDVARLKNWQGNQYIADYFKPGSRASTSLPMTAADLACPPCCKAIPFAYLPDKTGGALDSYAALFDPKFRGYVAIEDNYTSAGQKTALYLKAAGLAGIKNPVEI